MKSSLKSTTLLAITVIAFLAPVVSAQDTSEKKNTDNTSANRLCWEDDVPGGSYMGTIDRISSVSIHSYILAGFLIHEVDVEISGAALARFYTIDVVGSKSEANIAKNLIDCGGNRAEVDPTTTAKKTPQTTHSKTIEYKLSSKQDLDQLYNSLKRAFKEGRGRKFTIK